jgi:hypothetical protein
VEPKIAATAHGWCSTYLAIADGVAEDVRDYLLLARDLARASSQM